MSWQAQEAAEAVGGQLLYGDGKTRFSGVSIDSRTTAEGDLFIAIVGASHDGHRHAENGLSIGQKGVMVNAQSPIGLPHDLWRQKGFFCIAVADTTRALGDLAAYNRKRAGVPVVAITGSNGKTSTRLMTTAVMQQKFNVLSPKGNFNNEIGLPLTLLECGREHTMAVLELGMNHFGEIRRLAEICRPDLGIITNVGPAHLEGVGSIEGVAQAKGELLEHIKPQGAAILNGDDPLLRKLADQRGQKVLYFGFSKGADVRAESVDYGIDKTTFTLKLPERRTIGITLNVPGRFMVSNALAAAACGFLMGLSPKQIHDGLLSFRAYKGRLNIETTAAGIHLIDDTYNANPASMAAALELLSNLKNGQRAIFVCGDMFELGEQAEALHQNIGAAAAETGVNRLYAVGRFSSMVAKGALEKGMPEDKIKTDTKTEITTALMHQLQPGDWVLVKGSRAMAMETIAEAIRTIEKTICK